MAATDHPLKRLVSTCITEFASWLLSAPVRVARPQMMEMVERLLEDETGLLDTPYLRRIREEGREEGALAVWQRNIIEDVTSRFAPPPAVLQQVQQALETHMDEAALAQLFTAALRSASLSEFQEALEQA